jgi:hypothetical protein
MRILIYHEKNVTKKLIAIILWVKMFKKHMYGQSLKIVIEKCTKGY